MDFPLEMLISPQSGKEGLKTKTNKEWENLNTYKERENLQSEPTSTAQSYDLMCIVPKRSLLNTVIPG